METEINKVGKLLLYKEDNHFTIENTLTQEKSYYNTYDKMILGLEDYEFIEKEDDNRNEQTKVNEGCT